MRKISPEKKRIKTAFRTKVHVVFVITVTTRNRIWEAQVAFLLRREGAVVQPLEDCCGLIPKDYCGNWCVEVQLEEKLCAVWQSFKNDDES